jgi:hypothetical protein
MFMKTLKKITALFLAFLILGCYEVNDEITIQQDGSGTYSSKMDLGQLLEMMQAMGGDELKKEGLDKAIDTTVLLKSMTDSAKDLDAATRTLLSNGKMRFQMNLDKKIFKIDLDCPFKNYQEFQMLLSGSGMAAMTKGLKNVFDKKGEADANQPDTPKDPDMGAINDVFDVIAKDGSISKKVNKAKFDELMAKPEMEQFKQAGGMGMEVLYTTVIKLPRPVKSTESEIVKLSDDKKTVTIKYNYLETFQTPEKFQYTITY